MTNRSHLPNQQYFNNFFNFNKPEEEEVETPSEENFKDGAYDEDDPVEKMFGFFFGKREEEPMGMKRFDRERFLEQYPATKTEFAEPVSTDTTDMAKVRPCYKTQTWKHAA